MARLHNAAAYRPRLGTACALVVRWADLPLAKYITTQYNAVRQGREGYPPAQMACNTPVLVAWAHILLDTLRRLCGIARYRKAACSWTWLLASPPGTKWQFGFPRTLHRHMRMRRRCFSETRTQ